MGIEPTSEAWEASILPLYDARSVARQRRLYTIETCSEKGVAKPAIFQFYLFVSPQMGAATS